jgi:hypothetical protein
VERDCPRVEEAKMAYEDRQHGRGNEQRSSASVPVAQRTVAPGKRTLTASLSRRATGAPAPVQMKPRDPAAAAAREAQATRTQQWLDMAVRPDLYVETMQGSSAGTGHDPAAMRDGIDLEASSETLTDDIEIGNAEGGNADSESAQSESAQSESAQSESTRSDGGQSPSSGSTAEVPQLDDQVAAVPTVTFGRIDYATTPAGMDPRIPPRRSIRVPVTISGGSNGTRVTISIDGAGGSNGDGTLNGQPSVTRAASSTITLRGTQQTAAGSAGNLSLVARVGGTEVGRSNTFTICALPTRVRVTYAGPITGNQRGIRMTTYNNSDSGNVADLDEVEMSEMVQYQNGTGCFAGITSGNNSGYLPANVEPHGEDSHGTPVSLVTGPGYIESVQGFKFQDARSGEVDTGVANSGFMITRTATENAAGTKHLTTTKYGAATTVSGISVQAGQGRGSRRQRV